MLAAGRLQQTPAHIAGLAAATGRRSGVGREVQCTSCRPGEEACSSSTQHTFKGLPADWLALDSSAGLGGSSIDIGTHLSGRLTW